jgi:hypothetical protein
MAGHDIIANCSGSAGNFQLWAPLMENTHVIGFKYFGRCSGHENLSHSL